MTWHPHLDISDLLRWLRETATAASTTAETARQRREGVEGAPPEMPRFDQKASDAGAPPRAEGLARASSASAAGIEPPRRLELAPPPSPRFAAASGADERRASSGRPDLPQAGEPAQASPRDARILIEGRLQLHADGTASLSGRGIGHLPHLS